MFTSVPRPIVLPRISGVPSLREAQTVAGSRPAGSARIWRDTVILGSGVRPAKGLAAGKGARVSGVVQLSAPPSRRSPLSSGSAVSVSGISAVCGPAKRPACAPLDIAPGLLLLGGGERRVGEKDQARMCCDELRQCPGGDAGGSREGAAEIIKRAEKGRFGVGAARVEPGERGVQGGIGEGGAAGGLAAGQHQPRDAVLQAGRQGKRGIAGETERLPGEDRAARGFREQGLVAGIGKGMHDKAAIGPSAGVPSSGGSVKGVRMRVGCSAWRNAEKSAPLTPSAR